MTSNHGPILEGLINLCSLLSLSYLTAISFHDQCPSSTSACANAVTGHVTIHRDFSTASLQHVSFIYSQANNEKQDISGSSVQRHRL